MQCILCGQESAYHRVITTAWINGLPQAFQMQTKDSIVGKVACRPCYRLGEQIVQKLKALRESLGVLKDITGIALDATVRGQETELLDQVPPLESPVETTDLRKRPLTSPDISARRCFTKSLLQLHPTPSSSVLSTSVRRNILRARHENRGACQHRGRRPLGR